MTNFLKTNLKIAQGQKSRSVVTKIKSLLAGTVRHISNQVTSVTDQEFFRTQTWMDGHHRKGTRRCQSLCATI